MTFIFPPTSTGGGGAVASVNGFVGVVVLDANDVGAASQQLDNLGLTAINADLLFDTGSTYNIGASGVNVASMWVDTVRTVSGGLTLLGTGGINSGNLHQFDAGINIYDTPNGFGVIVVAPTLAADYTLTLPVDAGTVGQVLTTDGAGILSWASAGSGANTALSNLTPTSINEHLIPNVSQTFDLGAAGLAWSGVYAVAIADDNGNTAFLLGTGSVRKMYAPTGAEMIDFSTDAAVNIGLAGDATAQVAIRWYDDAGAFYAGIQAPASLAANYTLTLPADDGLASQVLTTDGAGILSWTTPATGANTALSNLTATSIAVDLKPASATGNDLGTAALPWGSVYADNFRVHNGSAAPGVFGRISSAVTVAGEAFATNDLQLVGLGKDVAIHTNAISTGTNKIVLGTGSVSTSGNSGVVRIGTGDVTGGSGDSGALTLYTGTSAGGNRGNVVVEANSLVLPISAADPATNVVAGSIYYNSTANKIKMYNGTTWETVTSI